MPGALDELRLPPQHLRPRPATSPEEVDAFHRAGVEAGYRDNGAPRPRYEGFAPGIYAAYLLDPDGNNVEAVHRAPAA